MHERRFQKRSLFLIAYLIFALLPIYWMVNMSFKTNEEILSSFSLWPQAFTWDNYKTIFTAAKAATKKRVAYAEGEEERVLRAHRSWWTKKSPALR